MPLDPGARLGPYEITGPLGAGGMGEVYRARDTRLGREVAVKILPPDIAEAAGSRERFEREAQVVSSLSHRNICTLHDVGREGNTDYLVMELLEGETLASRLERGPLKLDEALRVGAEIAGALDAAHRAGIVHRDLKPGNVMLTRGGAKVLDFGIAKLTEAAGAMPGHPLTAMPTRATPLTAQGALVGTLSYMAPEQLEGKAVDHRADIFALGAVLYEMLTGRRAFDGASQASVIAGILERDPAPVASVVPMTPASLDRLVRECLAKDPESRRQSAHDLASELRGIAESPVSVPAAGTATTTPRASSKAAWIVAVAAIALAEAFGALWLRHSTPAPSVIEVGIPLNARPAPAAPAVSPDGKAVAYSDPLRPGEKSVLWVRRLDDARPRALDGTDAARRPFWSPDGRELGYFAGGKLMVVPTSGGRPRAVCDASYGVGAAWFPSGAIVFSASFNEGLERVDPGGGTPQRITELDLSRKETGHVWPVALPDGRHFLFVSRTIASEPSRIEMGSLDGGSRKVVVEADALGGYAAPWLLFAKGGVLFAQRFDPRAGTLSGARAIVAADVRFDESWVTVGASVGGDTLAWTAHRPRTVAASWFDAKGQAAGAAFEETDVIGAKLSPDGTRVAMAIFDPVRGGGDLWVLDLARSIKTRLTATAGDDGLGAWSADGRELLFVSDERGPYGLYLVPADGSGEAREVFLEMGNDWSQPSATPDGRTLYVERETTTTRRDIWTVPLEDPGRRTAWLATEAYESNPQVSPDGRWVAYVSDRSGKTEIYARRADGTGLVQLSVHGGDTPRWAADGRAVWYDGPDGKLHRVPLVMQGKELSPGPPDRTSEIDSADLVTYGVAPDGRLLLLRNVSGSDAGFVVRVSWMARLK